MAEAEPTSSTSPPPSSAVMGSAPKRATGEIPLSWAMPAEAVSDTPPAASSRTVVTGLVAAAVAIGLAVVASTTIGRAPAPSPPAVATAPATNSPATTTVTPAPVAPTPQAPVVATPPASPSTMTAPTTTSPTATTTTTPTAPATTATSTKTAPTGDAVPPSRLKARALVLRARIAARDGDRPRALALAEQAVAADDGCGGCWKTLGLLRRLSGDKAGGAEAKARAEAASDPLP